MSIKFTVSVKPTTKLGEPLRETGLVTIRLEQDVVEDSLHPPGRLTSVGENSYKAEICLLPDQVEDLGRAIEDWKEEYRRDGFR